MAKVQTFEQKKKYKTLRPRKADLTQQPATDIKGVSCESRVTEGPNRKDLRAEKKKDHEGSKVPPGVRRNRRRAKNAVAKAARKVSR